MNHSELNITKICEKELKGKGLKTDTQITESLFAYIAPTKRSFYPLSSISLCQYIHIDTTF